MAIFRRAGSNDSRDLTDPKSRDSESRSKQLDARAYRGRRLTWIALSNGRVDPYHERPEESAVDEMGRSMIRCMSNTNIERRQRMQSN